MAHPFRAAHCQKYLISAVGGTYLRLHQLPGITILGTWVNRAKRGPEPPILSPGPLGLRLAPTRSRA